MGTVPLEVKKVATKKHGWVIEKHQKALIGTGFEDCAPCPGCAPEKIENEKMKCSRCGPTGVLITPAQAQRCDGTRPPPYNRIQKNKKRTRVQKRSS